MQTTLKKLLKRVPGVHAAYRAWNNARFAGSASYWDERYRSGGNSGDGSYGQLAAFKAEVLNRFVAEHDITSVIELGCGDGNQLSLAHYPMYTGLDVSPAAIERCVARFGDDATKSFFLYDPAHFHDRAGRLAADCALSLDVLYHLIEDAVYERYLAHLFQSARRYVIIYSSNQDMQGVDLHLREGSHVRHRPITRDIAERMHEFELVQTIPNRFPQLSFASFFIYARTSVTSP